jgi:hypothetical protein
MAGGVSAVVVGVDTHADVHVAAALDPLGRHLGILEIATTTRGYEQLLRWAKTFGPVTRFGVEGTGSYGAGLARHLAGAGCTVIESTAPTAGHDAHAGSPIRSTLKQLRELCLPVQLRPFPKRTTTASA